MTLKSVIVLLGYAQVYLIGSSNTIIARRWDIQAGEEVRMCRGLFLLLLCLSQMRDIAAVFNGKYGLLTLLSLNTHQNCDHGQIL